MRYVAIAGLVTAVVVSSLVSGSRAVASVTPETVDSRGFTGAENAIYAPNRHVVFVAYKRFLRNPYDPGGEVVNAQLRVAKSVDGGRTWSVTVVDRDAPESGDTLQQSVSIGGHNRADIYVAYLREGAHNSLRVARSTDAGLTWTTTRIATGVGEYNATKVIDAEHALVAANRGFPDGLRLYSTTDGRQWDGSTVDDSGWYTGLDVARGGRIWASHYEPGETALYVSTATLPAGPWDTNLVAGAAANSAYTGLGSSLAVARGGVYVSYEDFSGGRSLTWLSSSTDRGGSWSASRVGRGGWNTSVHALDGPAPGVDDLYVAWWAPSSPPDPTGRVKVAHSTDGGETWSRLMVPERRFVDFYLDLAAPTRAVQYVSYQATRDRDEGSVLRVARVHAEG